MQKDYYLIDKQTRKKLTQQAEQEQQHGPNPQKGHFFSQQDWLDFRVIQNDKVIKLNTYREIKTKEPLGLIIMFHGLNSHLNHGGHLAKRWADEGFIVIGFDYRGFGKSEGSSAYMESFQLHLNDSLRFFKQVKKHQMLKIYPQLPIFLTGLSLGGLTAFHLSIKLRHQIQGVILMAPALKPALGNFIIGVTNVLGSILPKFSMKMKSKPVANRNPAITQYIRADKYAFNGIPALATSKNLLQAMKDAHKYFKMIQIPMVVVMGGRDKLVDCTFLQQLIPKAMSTDKQVWFFEKMWHNIWHQPQIQQILDRSVLWLKRHLK